MIKGVLLAADDRDGTKINPLPRLLMYKSNGTKCESGKAGANFTL